MPKRKITDNIPLKIASLVIGFLIWLVVINVDNPIESKTFIIQGDSVELLNTAYIDSMNKTCMRDSNPDPVRVTVTAEKKTLAKLSSSDIFVVADLQQVVSLDSNPVMVPISASSSLVASNRLRVSPQFLDVKLEDKASAEFVVNPGYGDSRPGKGYEVGVQSVSPEKVKITGPRSLINKIDKVMALVSVEGKIADFTEEVSLTVIDKNQDILSEGTLAYLTIDNGGKASVTTQFWKVQPGVRIEAQYSGQPAKGYQVEKVSTVPDTISLAGTSAALDSLRAQENLLRIGADEINIEGMTSDHEQKVSLADLLPEGTRLTSGSSEDVYVTVVILPEGAHIYHLAANQVEITNLAPSLQVAFDADSLELRIMQDDENAEPFRLDDIRASVNLADMGEGKVDVPVRITLSEGYSLLEDVTASVVISKITTVQETAGGEE